MKKTISLLTLLFLIIVLITVSAVNSSAMDIAVLTMTDSSGQIGEEISVDINLDKNPGIITMRFTVSWDDQLELVGVSNAQLLAGWTTPAPTVSSPYTLRWADSLSTSNNEKIGRIATLTFKIKETASAGNSNITLSFLESRNAKGEEIIFNNTTTCIDIFCKNHDFPDPQPLNGNEHIYRCDNCNYFKKQAHSYTNDCDKDCNFCGATRTVAGHQYTNACDTSCNICGATRTVEGHKYTNTCDTSCNICGASRSISHSYSNACDTSCNVCGATRTVEGHKYTNTCDTTCDKCGKTRSITHTYSNACDTSCNICGVTRTVEGHKYANNCDTTCDKCGKTRSITHTYSNTCDTSCNVCGTARSITHAYGSYVYNNDATAAKDGTKTRTCSVCGVKDTVTAVGTKIKNPFTDVKAGEYYTEPVLWAVGKGITNGTSATTFSPNAQCTRGQIVTFLWRAAGSPEPQSTRNPFKDVKSDQYYYKAVLWAVEKGVTTGVSATEFAPNATCTRGQVVTFLWRAKGKPSATASTAFTDVKAGQYYTEAVAWAVKNGVTTGISPTEFAPNATCTRGQIVTFLYRAYK